MSIVANDNNRFFLFLWKYYLINYNKNQKIQKEMISHVSKAIIYCNAKV